MEGANNTNDYFFPKRAGINQTGQSITLATNFFKLSFLNNNSKCFFKYAVDFDPELPGDSAKLRRKVWNSAREQISKVLGHTIFNNTTCYSEINYADPIVIDTKIDEQEYKVQIKWTNLVENSTIEALSLYKRFISTLVRKINFTPIRRSFFDPKNAKTVDGVELWPGFNSTVNIFPSGTMLNMNIIYKVLRSETALEAMNKLKNKFRNPEEMKEELQALFKNNVVLTRYNTDKTYVIDSVDFEKSPRSTFETKKGSVTFMDYYSTKYEKNISDPDQPLLLSIDKKRNQSIYLIPEFCFLTGLTDEMRANFNMMKQMATITKGNANEKMKECMSIIQMFLKNEKCQEDIKQWGLTISDQPVGVIGRKLDAGNIIMHRNGPTTRFNFPIEKTDDIDRKIQAEMFSQPKLAKWMVISTGRDEQTCQSFVEMLKGQVAGSFKYQIAPPLVLKTNGTNYREWEDKISEVLNKHNDVTLVVLVLPGGKGKGINYNELKRLLINKYAVPSQVALASTLSKPKGVRSVVNKILMQICAKVGGEPWAVDQLPFTNAPTMVVGLDMYNKGDKTIIGCCATYNSTFTKYTSIVKTGNVGADLSHLVGESISEAKNYFTSANNKIAPSHVIVIRDGISPTQMTIATTEVNAILTANPGIKMTYILLNKKTTIKVFVDNNKNYSNIPPGTLVDDLITDPEKCDFFLVSQKSNQGLSQATHYNVVYDNFNAAPQHIHLLIYKLCYLYYNWTGGIKLLRLYRKVIFTPPYPKKFTMS
jgi:aubergine